MPTKPCIVCGEQIQEIATRCPHCHQVQSKAYQFFNTGWGVASIFLIVALGFVYFAMKEPVHWSDHAMFVKSSEVKMKATTRARGTEMTCIALLRNEGKYSWKDPVVEASFFGADGQLIDTATQRLISVVIRAGGEARIRVLEQAAWDANEYARCEVTLRQATLD